MKQRGFTVIELLIAVVLLAIIGVLFWNQLNNAERGARDDKRRTAINAMHYDLEDVFYAKNHYYPQTINSKNLTAMDPALFKDPEGISIGTGNSDYSYSPTNCQDGQCGGYTLRASMEAEGDYVKHNQHQTN